MENKQNNKDIKRDRFVRIVEKRVNSILNNFDSLGKCSNKKNYDYSDRDIRVIFSEIDKKSKEIKSLFSEKTNKGKVFKLER